MVVKRLMRRRLGGMVDRSIRRQNHASAIARSPARGNVIDNSMCTDAIKMNGPQVRAFQFDRASSNEEERTMEISFSSETRDVVRWFGIDGGLESREN